VLRERTAAAITSSLQDMEARTAQEGGALDGPTRRRAMLAAKAAAAVTTAGPTGSRPEGTGMNSPLRD
jgi:hypothetical protein